MAFADMVSALRAAEKRGRVAGLREVTADLRHRMQLLNGQNVVTDITRDIDQLLILERAFAAAADKLEAETP